MTVVVLFLFCLSIQTSYAFQHNSRRAVQEYLSFLSHRGFIIEGGEGGGTVTVTPQYSSSGDTGAGRIAYLTSVFLNEYGQEGCGIYDFVKTDMWGSYGSYGIDMIVGTIKRHCGK